MEASCSFARQILRTSFSEIDFAAKLTLEEIGVLKEKKESTLRRIFLTLRIAAKLHGLKGNPTDIPWFQAFRILIGVRNKLTHPTSPQALELSSNDIQSFARGTLWFIASLASVTPK